MQYPRSLLQASPRIVAACKKLLMMIGRIAFSSKLPCEPANAMALSSDKTWMQTITMASHWVVARQFHQIFPMAVGVDLRQFR